MLERLRAWAQTLKLETLALYYAVRDPRCPWLAKLVAGMVVAYALSPIDLIPDFIPVLGLLDELVVLPAGLWLAVRLIPPHVLEAARARAVVAHLRSADQPKSWLAAACVILIWILLAALCGWAVYRAWVDS